MSEEFLFEFGEFVWGVRWIWDRVVGLIGLGLGGL